MTLRYAFFVLACSALILTYPSMLVAQAPPKETKQQLRERLALQVLARYRAEQSLKWEGDDVSGWSLKWTGPDGALRGPIELPPRKQRTVFRKDQPLALAASDPWKPLEGKINRLFQHSEVVTATLGRGYSTCFSPDGEHLGLFQTLDQVLIAGWDGQGEGPSRDDSDRVEQRFEVYGAKGRKSHFSRLPANDEDRMTLPALSIGARWVAFYHGFGVSLFDAKGELIQSFEDEGTGYRFAGGGPYLILVRNGVLFSVYDAAAKAFRQRASSIPPEVSISGAVADVDPDTGALVVDEPAPFKP